MTFERLRYWQGQRLRSRDFRDEQRYRALLRAWHNRGLHETGGIAAGLEISTDSTTGDVTVSCGLGYDCAGRELILSRPTRVVWPDSDQPRLLVLLPPDAGQGASLVWVDELDLDRGRGLPLARFSFAQGKPLRDGEFTSTMLRPMARVRMAGGETVRDNTPWEVWLEDREAVGVQTLVDTSAAGFTGTPQYFARLQANAWLLKPDPEKPGQAVAEFAPAFFSHVAGQTSERFLFRILLKGVGLRAYRPEASFARITALAPGAAGVRISLDNAQPFAANDAIVQVRPRGDKAALVTRMAGGNLKLNSLMSLVIGEFVALGNLPRRATVTQVTQETELTLSGPAAAAAGDFVALFHQNPANSRVARMLSAGNPLRLRDPFTGVAAGDSVRVFDLASGVTAAVDAQATQTVLTITNEPARETGDLVIQVSEGKPSLPSAVIRAAAGEEGTQKLTVRPAIAGASANATFVFSRDDIPVKAIAPADALYIELDGRHPFATGDLVRPTDPAQAPSAIGIVDDTTIRVTQPASWAQVGDVLIAANRSGAVGVVTVSAVGSVQAITAKPARHIRTGDAVVRPDVAGAVPVAVSLTGGGAFVAAQPIQGLSPGHTLAVLGFPGIAKVTQVISDLNFRIEPADAFRPGDWIANLDSTTAVLSFAQIADVPESGVVRLTAAIPGVAVNTALGQVHFRDLAKVGTVDTANNEIATDSPLDVRAPHDFLAVSSADRAVPQFGDTSEFALIDSKQGNDLIVREGGEGLIARGAFDAGLVAFASLSESQPRLTLQDATGLVTGSLSLVGVDDRGAARNALVSVAAVDTSRHRVSVSLSGFGERSLRPERLSLVSGFDNNFPRDFAAFAQKQGLYVGWFACLQERRTPPSCDPSPMEDPCL